MAKVFFSYSHDDEQFRDQLEKHLSMLKHQGLIEPWHDRRITAGSAIDEEISDSLEQADIILLLVSASFIASAYCYSLEMKRAMERHQAGTAVVIPVIVRTCDWHTAPFGKLLAVPKDGKAIDLWANFDEAYTDVTKQIRAIVENLSRFFQGSLKELADRNPGIETKYQQIDATKFTATIYQHGKKASECAINMDGHGFRKDGVTFSYDA